MKRASFKFRTFSLITRLVIVTVMFLSCKNKIEFIPKTDLLSLPSLTVKDLKSVVIDSGKLQLIMSSPLLEQYDNIDFPYSEFRSGIKVIIYNGKTEPVATVSAKYAKSTNTNNTWELKDSVVVINENNYKLETEVLYWDRQKDLIYTDRFVRITNDDQIMMGTGFESDTRWDNPRIKKVSATIPLKDEE
jgi:LPS export ABC transporter protein LptC